MNSGIHQFYLCYPHGYVHVEMIWCIFSWNTRGYLGQIKHVQFSRHTSRFHMDIWWKSGELGNPPVLPVLSTWICTRGNDWCISMWISGGKLVKSRIHQFYLCYPRGYVHVEMIWCIFSWNTRGYLGQIKHVQFSRHTSRFPRGYLVDPPWHWRAYLVEYTWIFGSILSK